MFTVSVNADHGTQLVIASIVTWNHAHCIAACVQSLLEQRYQPLKIVLWDNNSTDDTKAVLERFRDRVEVLYSEENLGFCGGHNAILGRTRGEFVLLVNPDVVLPADYIDKAVSRASADPQVGTVCGLLLQNDPGDPACAVDGAGLLMARSRRAILRFHGVPYSTVPKEVREVFGCDGALPLFRRAMIDDISVDGEFFDSTFFAHKEDHDVAWRAQILGWKTVYDSSCVAVHPRHFRPGDLGLRRKMTAEIKFHAAKNDLMLLLKNEDWSNFLKDFFYIVPRRVAILIYTLLFEKTSLKAYAYALQNRKSILRKRRAIHDRRKASPAEVRRRFFSP